MARSAHKVAIFHQTYPERLSATQNSLEIRHMPALQNLVLKDRATTPVDHTFTPFEVVGGVAVVVESNGNKATDSKFSISRHQTPNKRWKVRQKLEVPVIEIQLINGVNTPVVVDMEYATVEYSFSSKSTTASRNNMVGMVHSSQDPTKVLTQKVTVDLEGVWGA